MRAARPAARGHASTTPTIDTGEWLANCAACCVPEIAGAFTRARIPYDTVAGTIDDDERAWEQDRRPGCAPPASPARCAASRIGFLGHTYPGMLDLYTDFTAVHAQLGAHVEVLEIDDLGGRGSRRPARTRSPPRRPRSARCSTSPTRRPTRSPGRSSRSSSTGRRAWPSASTGWSTTSTSTGSPTTTAASDGNEAERLGAGVIVGNSLLTARGVPTSGEGDLKTNIAQLILDRLGAGGSYTEYYALDFDEDFVLMGHDGPGHIAIAEGRPTLRALKLYHGKRGAGLSRRVQGPLRAGHDRRLHADRRGPAQADRRRGRVDPRRDLPHRQHQQPPALLRSRRPSSSSAGAPRARRTTSRSASATGGRGAQGRLAARPRATPRSA